jgi:hypothetical protein
LAGDNTTINPARNLTYRLLDSAGKVSTELANPGAYYGGGIVIAEPVITVDTSQIAAGGLAPGTLYRVIAFEPAHPGTRVEIPFRTPVGPAGLRPGRKAGTLRPKDRSRNVLGRIAPAKPGHPAGPVFRTDRF